MGNSCCYKSSFDLAMEVEDLSSSIKIDEVYIKQTDISHSAENLYSGMADEAVISSDSSVISV